MNFKELQADISKRIQSLKGFSAVLRKEYSESDGKIGFVKGAFKREILEKKERHPSAIITAWILLLLIFSYDWTFGMNWSLVFYFGALPFIVYYIYRTVKQAPSN